MQLHPWHITSWPIIEYSNDLAPSIAVDLRHLGTVVSDDCDDYGRFLGHTIWGLADTRLGLAWDWSETLDGVFALADPMGVVSNISFVDETGALNSDASNAVQLNQITHALPWQAEVLKATSSIRVARPWSTRMKLPTCFQFNAPDLGSVLTISR